MVDRSGSIAVAATAATAAGVLPGGLAIGESVVEVAAAALAAVAFSSSIRAEMANALLYVGHPEHAFVPPVPSQRPSPGQVPPERGVEGAAAAGLVVVAAVDDDEEAPVLAPVGDEVVDD